MTPEQQRIAIAEVCGWRRGHSIQWTDGYAKHYDWGWTDPKGLPQNSKEPPDYLNDLNAMHEAEETLGKKQWNHYRLHILPSVCWRFVSRQKGLHHQGQIEHATASQRAEAFLKTLKLWRD